MLDLGLGEIMNTGKVWGSSSAIFAMNNVEVHRIVIDQGGYCSLHRHTHKHNLFFVERGILHVEVTKNDYALTDTTVLQDGDITDVPPGEWHRFKAIVKTVAYEIYYTSLDAADIERKDCGGVDGKNFATETLA